jgi:hypothetical protein
LNDDFELDSPEAQTFTRNSPKLASVVRRYSDTLRELQVTELMHMLLVQAGDAKKAVDCREAATHNIKPGI